MATKYTHGNIQLKLAFQPHFSLNKTDLSFVILHNTRLPKIHIWFISIYLLHTLRSTAPPSPATTTCAVSAMSCCHAHFAPMSSVVRGMAPLSEAWHHCPCRLLPMSSIARVIRCPCCPLSIVSSAICHLCRLLPVAHCPLPVPRVPRCPSPVVRDVRHRTVDH